MFSSSCLPLDASVTLNKVPGESKSVKTMVLAGRASPRDHGGQVVSYVSCTPYPLAGQRGLEVRVGGGTLQVHGAGGLGGRLGSYKVQCGT